MTALMKILHPVNGITIKPSETQVQTMMGVEGYMGIYLNPGNEAFQISVSSEIYVDKSELIGFTNKRLGQEKRFLCVSRPRRFGKSMAANMLSAYYTQGCDSDNLFAPLKIAQHPSYKEHLNQYDVLFLNMQQFLSSAKGVDNLTAYLQKELMQFIQKKHPYCLITMKIH